MKNEVEQIALQNDMSIEFVTWFFNEKKVGCGNVWFMMMAAMWEGWKGRSIEMDKLAAENVALKQFPEQIVQFIGGLGTSEIGSDTKEKIGLAASRIKAPATDAYLAGIKADAIDEAAAELDRVDTVASTRVIGFKLREFSQQLREGAK
ncbi:TPA: hypothetical protein L9422_001051 [Klebsiella pneumoniae]|nr:hypothetical protein [Klebsiella pneumoniae]